MMNNVTQLKASHVTPDPSGGVRVALQTVGKNFDDRVVLKNIDLHIEAGEFVAIVGRSGCGKSTLLRLIANLDAPSSGIIQFDEIPADRKNDDLRIMFQDARLLPWKTVGENVALGLVGKKSEINSRVLIALEQVGLSDRVNEWPSRLSGGQRQRVALARALIHEPRLLLLDEPLGALDALTRIEMQELIRDIWQRLGFTALLVTHDVSEAIVLADRVLLVEDGGITLDLRVRLPRPRSRGAADFAALEDQVLKHVLGHEEHNVEVNDKPAISQTAAFPLWRWAP